MAAYQHVVALGSSFAAGPGIDPIVDRGALRSGRNYPSLLAERLGARLTDLTVSGATTATILDTPQHALWRRTFAPQLEGVPDDADLVTVTAGGNDLGYIGSMVRAASAGRLRSRLLTRPLAAIVGRGGLPAASDEAVEQAVDGLTRVVRAARVRAPRARVVLVDYLTLVGGSTRPDPGTPFTTAEIAAFRLLAERLADAFAVAAERTGADLVRASALSGRHGLGSADPWVTGFRTPRRGAPFHPNAAGMEAVAEAVCTALGTG